MAHAAPPPSRYAISIESVSRWRRSSPLNWMRSTITCSTDRLRSDAGSMSSNDTALPSISRRAKPFRRRLPIVVSTTPVDAGSAGPGLRTPPFPFRSRAGPSFDPPRRASASWGPTQRSWGPPRRFVGPTCVGPGKPGGRGASPTLVASRRTSAVSTSGGPHAPTPTSTRPTGNLTNLRLVVPGAARPLTRRLRPRARADLPCRCSGSVTSSARAYSGQMKSESPLPAGASTAGVVRLRVVVPDGGSTGRGLRMLFSGGSAYRWRDAVDAIAIAWLLCMRSRNWRA